MKKEIIGLIEAKEFASKELVDFWLATSEFGKSDPRSALFEGKV